MKRIIFLVSILVVLTISVNAQNISACIQWQKYFNNFDNEVATSIQQTNDSGYIVAGYTFGYSCGGGWIIKLDIVGNIQWQKCMTNYQSPSIRQTNDSGYIVAGFYSNDESIIGKLDSVGNLIWQEYIGGSGVDYPADIQQTNDGGYIVANTTNSNNGDVSGNHGNYDCWIVKLDTIGNILWQKCYGGTLNEEAYSIQQTTDGGYILASSTYSNSGNVTGNHGSQDYWIVKLDSLGNIQWQKCLGGTNADFASDIQQTNDGGYVIAGSTASYDGDVTGFNGWVDWWIVKLDSTGNIIWQKCLGNNEVDVAQSVQQTNDGSYIVAGYGCDYYSADWNYWIVKLDTCTTVGIKELTITNEVSIYPNPAQNTINITNAEKGVIHIYNVLGEEVLNASSNASIDVSKLTSGSYILKIVGKERVVVRKLIIND